MSSRKNIFKSMIQSGEIQSVADIDALVKELYKETLEGMLEAELDEELGYSRYDYRNKRTRNARNGKRSKKVHSSVGELEIEVPRDRNSEFEPQAVAKGQKDISSLEDKILSMYARGLSSRDITAQIEEIYGAKLSATTISRITDKILPVIQSWQNRPLENMYPLLWLDGFVLKVRTDNSVVNRCAHVIMGVNLDGYKEVLGIWLGENESSKYWLNVLTDLKNRGVTDILMCTVDGLSGFKDAIESVFPHTEVQRCIVHQVRYTTRFVQHKDRKEMCKDMKQIYTSANIEAGFQALESFAAKWGEKYGYAVKSWYDNWEDLSRLFRYTPEIRRLMYTTNPIESLNRQFRKATKTRSQFPNEDAALKILYLTVMKMEEKWKMRVQNWGLIVSQLAIHFEERITQHL